MTRHPAFIATACLCGLPVTPVLAGALSDNCDTESVQHMAPADTSVAFAAREGELCRVVGYVTSRDPGPNKVLFTLGLPNSFNGRYIYLGVGGAAGNLPALRPELIAKGFAVSGSDGGTGAKHYSDFSFKSNPAKLVDFRGRGVHVVATATQQITRTYYSRPQIHRYISGCSGGGSMGLVNALRFANQDFDGFVVGATPWPGHNVFKAEVFRLAQYLQTHPDAWIAPELLQKADEAILAAYDATDGAVDGIIADQRNIKDFDVEILRKSGFSAAQIKMFDLIRKPSTFKLPDGRTAIQPGYSVTNIASWTQYIFGTAPPPWPGTQSMSAEEVYGKGAPFFHVMADTNTRVSNPTLDYAQVKNPAKLTLLALAAGGDREFIADPGGAFSKFGASGAKMIVYHPTQAENWQCRAPDNQHQVATNDHSTERGS